MDIPPERLQDVTPQRLAIAPPELSWSTGDIEQRWGFKGGRFTATNHAATFLMAVILTALFYLFVIYGLNKWPPTQFIGIMFVRGGGYVSIAIALFFFWCFSILWIKSRKIKFQRKALDLTPFPEAVDFVLTPQTAADVLSDVHRLVDDTRHFVLFNRVERALSNLRNIGRVADVSDILKTQAEYDEAQQDSSFQLINGFIWAIPVIGFVGTVLGLSTAIGGFGATLAVAGEDISALKDSLGGITGGLATAFETTLIALIAALIIQVWMTFIQQRESLFLDECSDYCHTHIVSKLRLQED